MILLNVEKKCQNCPNFSPTVKRIYVTTLGGEKNISQTVYCGEKDFCKNLEEYLKNN